jgi:hypothetical protein
MDTCRDDDDELGGGVGSTNPRKKVWEGPPCSFCFTLINHAISLSRRGKSEQHVSQLGFPEQATAFVDFYSGEGKITLCILVGLGHVVWRIIATCVYPCNLLLLGVRAISRVYWLVMLLAEKS